MREAIKAWIDAHEEDMVRDLAELVAVPSISDASAGKPGAPFGPACREVLNRGLALARRMGFQAEDFDGYCGIVTIGPKHPSIGIVAHLDVVPVADGWQTPPFELTRRGEYVVGRGCNDNKGCAILALYVAKCLEELEIKLPCGLQILLGTSEETSMADMRYYTQHGDLPDLILVADCDYPVNYGQKGHFNATLTAPVSHIRAAAGGKAPNIIPDIASVELDHMTLDDVQGKLPAQAEAEACTNGVRIFARGKSGHAASPQSGDNAVRNLFKALLESSLLDAQDEAAVRALCHAIADDYGTSFGLNMTDEEFGPLTLVGSVLDVKDGKMTLSLDCRFPRSITGDEVTARAEAFVRENGLGMEAVSARNAFYIDRHDPLVQCMMDVYREETGDTREAFVMGGGTYSHVLPNAVTFGGSIPGANDAFYAQMPQGHGGAHQPDEALHIPSLKKSMVIYAQTLQRLAPMIAARKA